MALTRAAPPIMWLILIGLLLMLGGVFTLFAMIVGVLEGGLFLSLLAFLATVAGLVTGLMGVIRWTAGPNNPRRTPGEKEN